MSSVDQGSGSFPGLPGVGKVPQMTAQDITMSSSAGEAPGSRGTRMRSKGIVGCSVGVAPTCCK